MSVGYLIGLDYGSESARGVLLDAASGDLVDSRVHVYRHGIMTRHLDDGTPLPRGWALQNGLDYLEAAEEILEGLGRGRRVLSIGVGFTASSPLPTTHEGQPLSVRHPHAPHAYVKLWKHGAAQAQADAINAVGGAFLDAFGGKVSSEWLLAKAAQIAEEAPEIWAETERFIEAGDWLVWRLTGHEARGLGFAAYKAQYTAERGYPEGVVAGLGERLAPPLPVGSSAGALSSDWRERTGIEGPAVVAVAVIDSHVVLPAIGAVETGCLVGALGTSAVYLYLSEEDRPLPRGIEGVARDGSIRGLWCFEAGQACFGDVLAWFVRTFPLAEDIDESFRRYNEAAAALAPGGGRLVALDWWNGNRVPLADSGLSGLLIGLTMETTAAGIYRALMESLCYGALSVVDLFEAGGFVMERIVLTSGLAQNNPLLVQIMADVLGRAVEVPQMAHATAVGAAIHGAVAGGVVADYAQGAARYGAHTVTVYAPDAARAEIYRDLHAQYSSLSQTPEIRNAMHALNEVSISR